MATPTPPPPPGGSLSDMLMRYLHGLPVDKTLTGGMSAANPQEDSQALRGILANTTRMAQLLFEIRMALNRLRFGGGGGSNDPNNLAGGGPFRRLRGLLNIAGGGQGLGRALGHGNLASAAHMASMASRGVSMLAGAGMGAGAATALSGVGTVVGVVAGLVAFTIALKEAADAIIQHRRELAAFSPTTAQAYAVRDAREMLRDRELGERLGEKTGDMLAWEQRFKDKWLPVREWWEDKKSNFASNFYAAASDVMEKIEDVRKVLGHIEQQGQQARDLSFGGLINEAAEGAQKKMDAARAQAQQPRR